MDLSFHRYTALLLTYLRPQWRRAVLLTVLLFSTIGLQLINPQILRMFIDTATSGGSQTALTRSAVLFLAVALAQQAVGVAAAYVGQGVGWSATNALRADLALHCMRLDLSFHNQRTPGEMIERLDGDVTALANFFSAFVIQLLGSSILLVAVLIIVFRESWWAGLALTAFALITLTILRRIRPLATVRWRATRQANAELFGYLEERLAGTEDIRSSGASEYVLNRLFRLMRALMQTARGANIVGSLVISTTLILFAIGNGISLGIGAYFYIQGQMTIGTVYMLFYYTGLISAPLRQISEQVQDLQRASASVARIDELLHITSSIIDGTAALPSGALAVEFQNVSFAYEEQTTENKEQNSEHQEPRTNNRESAFDNPLPTTDHRPPTTDHRVLSDISFQLKPGSVLGLLGRTGSGKTTLTRLLLRLYDPMAGVVRLGDVDLRTTATNDLRRKIGVVTQEVQLFHASVRDNLTLFNPTVSDEHMLGVLEELGLWPWFQSLPDGLDTKLNSGNGGLSAGEAQLLALTRVFLKDPGLVILDEASARLDPATESVIERAIDRLLQGRTGIIIAHRLGTVLRADEILILEDGSTREYGPRQQLQRDPLSRFAQLLHVGLEGVVSGAETLLPEELA